MMQLKIMNPEKFSIVAIRKSLLLGAKIKVQKYSVNSDDLDVLRSFINGG